MKLLDGPLQAVGEQKLRGPIIRIGANPGPGGFQLTGYRGLDARQCVITAYTGGTAAVAPVGTNQVRLAPHANVSWRDIDPITGPEYLTPHCAVHLGPVGRGATIEFVRCERFGQWEQGALQSEAADVAPSPPPGMGHLPASYDARRAKRVVSSTAPLWFLGCTGSSAFVATSAVCLIGAFQFIGVTREPPGPVEEGLEFYKSVEMTQFTEDDAMLLKGLEQGYFAFVVAPNIDAAGSAAQDEWAEPENFDPMFMRYVTKSVDQHVRSWSFFRRLDAIHVEYGKVVVDLRKAGLPEVFAGIPYRETRYTADLTSEVCAKGYWQFMPETAHRVGKTTDLSFRVLGCRFIGNDAVRWAPTEIATPPNIRANAEYMQDGQCMITTCDVDDRTDLQKSTAAAIYTLTEAWQDDVFARSGSAVQLTITSHNAGYDDGKYGAKYRKRFNVKPAYTEWVAKNGESQGPYFTGQNIRCPNWEDKSPCGGAYMAETQHYAYNIVAQHLVAVCYYARNYGENPAFQPWRKYTASGGYCEALDIPTREEVKAKK